MSEEMTTLPSGIEICYETFGDPDHPAILLVMGLSGPMGWWDSEFCTQLSSRGYRVIRFDNRDTGRSTKLREHRVSTKAIIAAFFGRGHAPYGISDLADDAFGLLDHLGIERAHILGMSMGGMIVQTMALAHPNRVLSLTSMMSSTGNRKVGRQDPRVIPAMLRSAGSTRESYVKATLETGKLIGSPAYPRDEERERVRAIETYDRGWSATGVGRQMLAVLTQPDRTRDLMTLDIPATVIHGLRDRLVNPSGGRATANAIRGSELIEINGMGHDLPAQLNTIFIDAIVRTAERATDRV